MDMILMQRGQTRVLKQPVHGGYAELATRAEEVQRPPQLLQGNIVVLGDQYKTQM